MFKETVQERYRRWWEGKRCKCFENDEFKLVQIAEFIGPPSGVYGSVILHYSDGTKEYVHSPREAFKPRKSDVIVEEVSKSGGIHRSKL